MHGVEGVTFCITAPENPGLLLLLLDRVVAVLTERLEIGGIEKQGLVTSVRDYVIHDSGSGHDTPICAEFAERVLNEALVANLAPGVAV